MAGRTPREQLKIEFLQKCAEHGLTVAETQQLAERLTQQLQTPPQEKQAADPLLVRFMSALSKKPYDALWSGLSGVASSAGKTLGGLAVAAPFTAVPLAGAGLGLASARLSDVDDDDIDAMKQRELIELYRAQAERMRPRPTA